MTRIFMTKWIYVNTPKITRIAYNSEIKIMYIDFTGSIVDIPYRGVTEKIFKKFSKAKKIDDYYEAHIKDKFQTVEISTENKINCSL